MLWKCYTQYSSKFGKLSTSHKTGKGQFSFKSPKKAMTKNDQTTAQLHSSQASKVMLKILQAWLHHMWIMNFQMFKLDFKKAVEPEIKLSTSIGSTKKQESSRKTSVSALLTMPNALTVWITKTCRKFLKRWDYQTTWIASWEICMKVRKQQFELDMEQQTGSK